MVCFGFSIYIVLKFLPFDILFFSFHILDTDVGLYMVFLVIEFICLKLYNHPQKLKSLVHILIKNLSNCYKLNIKHLDATESFQMCLRIS